MNRVGPVVKKEGGPDQVPRFRGGGRGGDAANVGLEPRAENGSTVGGTEGEGAPESLREDEGRRNEER